MRAAALTMVYNEAFNLPLWLRYYGAQVGADNLFIIDDGSDDDSTDSAGNVVRLPRTEHDAGRKTDIMAAMCATLLCRYDVVVCVDCDEFVIPDPAKYRGLGHYLEKMEAEYATCIGLNVLHLLSEELPYNPASPILMQRRFAQFHSSGSKTAVTRTPLRWIAGSHSCDKPPAFDPQLYLVHLNQFDYGVCARRRAMLRGIKLSERAVAGGMSAHWRYDTRRYFREYFMDPANETQNGVGAFDFSQEIELMAASIERRNGIYAQSMAMSKIVEIPARMKEVL
jgi:glycosyl transferase family 2